MQTIYEASTVLVDDNPDLLVLVRDSLRTATALPYCASCTPRLMCPRCSSRLGTLTLTACWGWALARTTT